MVYFFCGLYAFYNAVKSHLFTHMTELYSGLVISHLGQGIAVEVNNEIILCQTRRKLETVAAGDRVKLIIVAQSKVG